MTAARSWLRGQTARQRDRDSGVVRGRGICAQRSPPEEWDWCSPLSVGKSECAVLSVRDTHQRTCNAAPADEGFFNRSDDRRW